MLKIDKSIIDTSELICKNIEKSSYDRGFSSQNILANLRNFVEYVVIKVYSENQDVDPTDYKLHEDALKKIRHNGKLNFLGKFHNMLQNSVSHYTYDDDSSERFMLKYYEYLLRIKSFLKEEYDLDVLQNIDDFPLDTDAGLSDYYKEIANRIDSPSLSIPSGHSVVYDDRYYVQKVNPFFVDERIYYEVTFTTANSNCSKFDRVIAFTKCEIASNYAIKFLSHKDMINVRDVSLPILVIDEYKVSIRPCEWNNFSRIFGLTTKCSAKSGEYRKLMAFLTKVKISLTELVSSEQDYYDYVRSWIIANNQGVTIYKILDKCRDIIIHNRRGANVLRYLLYRMNNRIIKDQYSKDSCNKLSGLHLKCGCIPFDKMPYCTALPKHNPKINDLVESIPILGHDHEHEFFARYIKNRAEVDGCLFTKIEEIKGFKREDIKSLIDKYNKSLYYKHVGRKLEISKGYVYIKEYVENTKEIINELQKLSSSGIKQYTEFVNSWMEEKESEIEDEKKEILRSMFVNSHVALIYGAAGTGKSTLISYIANLYEDKRKIFLANTHPAVDNMFRRVSADNSEYKTIAKFLSEANDDNRNCDILFIDECSTVNNRDMKEILNNANFKLLVLVGDVNQIESILFGNWFRIAREFVPETSSFELSKTYRTSDSNLLKVWQSARELDPILLEPLVQKGFVSKLDSSIFEYSYTDEVILCLNYDGLYGINNINYFLQSNNPNDAEIWGINTYKIGDPVLFNESNRFSPFIHNNSKGKIVGINRENDYIWFDIELEERIDDNNRIYFDLGINGMKFIGKSKTGNTVMSFKVDKYHSTDEDDDDNDTTVVPFQIAYAVSIHKAQGLEYDSVKIVFNKEVEERITYNIFYTAITRAKNHLKIYWSPETEQYILKRFTFKEMNRDVNLLKGLFGLKTQK